MMRQNLNYLVIAVILTAFVAVSPVYGSEKSDLQKLISSFSDPRMSTNDLAFVLATHGYDATPKVDHVEVTLEGAVYKLVPNSNDSGFAEIVN